MRVVGTRPSAFVALGKHRSQPNCLIRLLDRIEFDEEFLQLLIGDGRRRIGHQILRLLGLGEGDHVPNGIGSAQQHHEPVQPERDPAVGRRTIVQRVEQESELALPRVVFEVEVKDEIDLVGRSKHIRFVVDKAKQGERLKKKAEKVKAAKG